MVLHDLPGSARTQKVPVLLSMFGTRFIYLVDRNDDLNTCCFCMVDCFYSLRHHTVVRCNYQNGDISGVAPRIRIAVNAS